MMEKKSIRYSEAFKLQIVGELESGTLGCINEARERYGIMGCATIQRWLRAYGKNHLLAKVVHVQTPGERDRLKELKQENDALKRALADLHMKSALYESWLQAACEEFGISDIEAFKKNSAGGDRTRPGACAGAGIRRRPVRLGRVEPQAAPVPHAPGSG